MHAGADEAHATTYDDFATPGSWPGDRMVPPSGADACDLWDPATVVTCSGGRTERWRSRRGASRSAARTATTTSKR